MTEAKEGELHEEREGFLKKSLDILLKNKLTLAGMVIVAVISWHPSSAPGTRIS